MHVVAFNIHMSFTSALNSKHCSNCPSWSEQHRHDSHSGGSGEEEEWAPKFSSSPANIRRDFLRWNCEFDSIQLCVWCAYKPTLTIFCAILVGSNWWTGNLPTFIWYRPPKSNTYRKSLTRTMTKHGRRGKKITNSKTSPPQPDPNKRATLDTMRSLQKLRGFW